MEEREVDLRDVVIEGLRIVGRNLKWIVGITLICSVISYIHLRNLPDAYESTALIAPAKVGGSEVEGADSLKILLTNPINPYLKEIAKKMGMKEEAGIGLSGRFKVAELKPYLEIKTYGSSTKDAKQLADLICELILERQKNLMDDKIEISNDEMEYFEKEITFLEKEIDRISKSILQKEKTDILAQSYIYQSLITSKESAINRKNALQSELRKKKMDLKYYTTPAEVIAPASLLEIMQPVEKTGPFLTVTIVSFLALSVLSLIINYFKKTPSLQKP